MNRNIKYNYQDALKRIDELLKVVDNNTPHDDPNFKELISLSDFVENYEEEHFPIGTPSLREVIELRMFEMKLKQKDLADILGTSASRISEYLHGKRDITLNIARALHEKLDIDGDIILHG